MMRVLLWALCAFLCAGAVHSAPPVPFTVSLPDAEVYSLWVQAQTGPVTLLPITVTHKKIVALPGARGGDTLYVLDAHTGQIASHLLSVGSPLTLAVADFRPLSAPAAVSAPVVPAPVSQGTRRGGLGQFVSWLLGLALAAGIVWFLMRMVQTRGEPLVALARRVGIDVPDPKALDPNAGAMPVYQPPQPRAVETIPDEAGQPPQAGPSASHEGRIETARPSLVPRSAGAGEKFVPQLVGLEGLAAGSTFALANSEVTVGREGSNDIVLAEDSVSRRHARLTRGENGDVHLADMDSANGIFVNGRRVQEVVLVVGDEIRIGNNSFRLEAPIP